MLKHKTDFGQLCYNQHSKALIDETFYPKHMYIPENIVLLIVLITWVYFFQMSQVKKLVKGTPTALNRLGSITDLDKIKKVCYTNCFTFLLFN